MNPDGKGCVPSCITADKSGLTAGLKKEYGYVVKKVHVHEKMDSDK